MGAVFRNNFSWSFSRDGTFQECLRRYYFQYYGSWGGWEPDAPARVRDVYVLKQLNNRYTWIGRVVHECIERSLANVSRGIPVLPVERILEITRDRMRRDFRSSRRGEYRTNPKHACGLFEHEYHLDVPDEQWREAAEQVDRCLENFYASDAWAHLSRLAPDRFLEVEQLSKFTLDGDEITTRLDCAVRESDHVVVWDWKTGKREPEGPGVQLACYAFYLSQRYGVSIPHVVMRRFDLYHNAVDESTIAERELGEVLSYIRGSIADMKALLEDPGRNIAREERFRKVNRRELCYRCNFLRVCDPELPGLQRARDAS